MKRYNQMKAEKSASTSTAPYNVSDAEEDQEWQPATPPPACQDAPVPNDQSGSSDSDADAQLLDDELPGGRAERLRREAASKPGLAATRDCTARCQGAPVAQHERPASGSLLVWQLERRTVRERFAGSCQTSTFIHF